MKLPGDAQRIQAEIESLLAVPPALPDELQGSLARYLCVLASSYLETSCRQLVVEYARCRSDHTVVKYVETAVSGFRDPNMEKILQLIGRFSVSLRDTVTQQVSDKTKESVDSIYANRNSVAHGRQSGISIGQIRGYYEDAKALVVRLHATLGLP